LEVFVTFDVAGGDDLHGQAALVGCRRPEQKTLKEFVNAGFGGSAVGSQSCQIAAGFGANLFEDEGTVQEENGLGDVAIIGSLRVFAIGLAEGIEEEVEILGAGEVLLQGMRVWRFVANTSES
jgi:hypothetical protein